MRWMVLWFIWGCSLFFAMVSGGAAGWFLVISLGFLNLFACLAKFAGVRVQSWERRMSRSEVEAGHSVKVRTTLHIQSRFPLVWVQIEERWRCPLDEGEWTIKKLGYFGRKKQFSYEYSLPELPRGTYRSEELLLYYGDGLGITQSKKKLPDDRIISVYPKPLDRLSPFSKLESDGGMPSTVKAYSSIHSEPDGLRDYRAGDSMKHIHWKQSAKYGKLKTLERTKLYEEQSGIWIHGKQPAAKERGRNPVWETMVCMAAGLLQGIELYRRQHSSIMSIEDEAGQLNYMLADHKCSWKKLLSSFPYTDHTKWLEPPDIVNNQSWTVLTSALEGEWMKPLLRTRKGLKLIYVSEALSYEDRERLDEMGTWGIETVFYSALYREGGIPCRSLEPQLLQSQTSRIGRFNRYFFY